MKSARSLSTRLAFDVAPVAVVAVVGALTIAFWTPSGDHRGSHPFFLAAVLAENVVALLMRRRHPIAAFAGVVGAYVLFDALPISLLPIALAIVTVSALRSRRSARIATASAAIAFVAVPVIHGDPFDAAHVLLPLVVTGFAVAVGRHAAGARLRPVPTS